jgi:hypothetical protein
VVTAVRSKVVLNDVDTGTIAPEARAQLKERLDALGYPYWDETDNPAYRLFLAGDFDAA